MKQPDLYCFEAIKMTSQAKSKFTENTRHKILPGLRRHFMAIK